MSGIQSFGLLARSRLAWPLVALFIPVSVVAQEHQPAQTNAHESTGHHKPHHLSVLLANTQLLIPGESDENGFTVGLDYEYRLNQRFGLGAVAEYAGGYLDATTVLGAVDVHVKAGLVIQLGVGVEFIEGTANELGRVGVLYEFEFGELTLSPQFHWDVTSAEDSLVFGLAFGRNF